MTWFLVDDNLTFHRKVIAAGNAAMGLWVRAGAQSARELSDGFVPKSMANQLGTRAQIAALIRVGLWRDVDGGYEFHDWLDINDSRERVQEKRRSNRDRQSRFRGRNALLDEPEQPVSNASDNALRNGVSNGALPSPPLPVPKETSSPRPRKRGSRIPDDFAVTAEMVSWAQETAPHVDGKRETEKFVNHWLGESGAAATKIDWTAAWKKWILIAADRQPSRNGTPRPTSNEDSWMRAQ
jgi:hypothetical protein